MGSLYMLKTLGKYRKVNGEVSIYKRKSVKIYHGPGDRCYIRVAIAQERGWI